MGSPAAGRLAREIEHHRGIAADAETVWNWDSPAGRRRAERRAALYVRHAALRSGVRALELGCGTGLFLAKAAASGASIRGIDLTAELLARARTRVAAFPNVRLDCGNAEQLPYRDGAFDAVYGSSVLHHLVLKAALGEAFRVLRPGGRVVFTEPNLLNPQVAFMFLFGPTKRFFGVSPDEMAFSRFRAVAALRAAGFVEVHVEPFDFLHPSLPQRWLAAAETACARLERVPGLREIAGSLLIRAVRP
jgi:SAM-dependent methyltransferase